MLSLLATLSFNASRRTMEIGLLLGMIGSLALAAGALPSFRRYGLPVGGLLLAVGFALAIWAVHFGISPYRG